VNSLTVEVSLERLKVMRRSVFVFQFRVAVDAALNVTLCSASSVPMTTEPYGGWLLLLGSGLVCTVTPKDGES